MQSPVVAVEVDVASGRGVGSEGFVPEGLGPHVGVWDGDVPLAGVGGEGLLDRGLAGAPAPIGFEDEELCHEPAWVAAGEWAFVDDEGEAGDLVVGHDEVGKAPEAVEEVVLVATIVAHRERHELGHVVEVELDQIGDDGLLIGLRGDEAD